MINEDSPAISWRLSSATGSTGECVEVAMTADAVWVRDSKNRHRARLVFSPAAWQTFITNIRNNDLKD